MRIGTMLDPAGASRQYRVAEPLNAMGRRGHQLVAVEAKDNHFELDPLTECDVVHIYRFLHPFTLDVARHLIGLGIAVVWDVDDDYSVPLPELPPGLETLDDAGRAELFALSVEIAKTANRVTVTTETLADRYEETGVPGVEVIPNCAVAGKRPVHPHEGLVIGWIAGWEHWHDARTLGLRDALERVMERHPHVRVECIGTDLELTERYRHDTVVPFFDLLERMGSFDIGIAPLTEGPFNVARSDIKVKEYAASGVAWLASDYTPYAGLGPEQGGLLVGADGWFEALDRLVRNDDERRQLAANGQQWAASQTIEATADQWERTFVEAATAMGRSVSAGAFRSDTGGPVRIRAKRPDVLGNRR